MVHGVKIIANDTELRMVAVMSDSHDKAAARTRVAVTTVQAAVEVAVNPIMALATALLNKKNLTQPTRPIHIVIIPPTNNIQATREVMLNPTPNLILPVTIHPLHPNLIMEVHLQVAHIHLPMDAQHTNRGSPIPNHTIDHPLQL